MDQVALDSFPRRTGTVPEPIFAVDSTSPVANSATSLWEVLTLATAWPKRRVLLELSEITYMKTPHVLYQVFVNPQRGAPTIPTSPNHG